MELPREIQQIDKLTGDLMAPTFSYRMARGRLMASLAAGKQGDPMYRGAHLTMLRSAKKIHNIVMEYRALPAAFIGAEVLHEEG